jgi:hypothetical protein
MVPRVTLPITRDGLTITDRVCWVILAVAMAIAAGLTLYLNRGTTFFVDELAWVSSSPTLSGAGDVLEPHNGHLIATTRLIYKAVLESTGPDYVAFRGLAVLAILLSTGIFFSLVKRRIGALPALAPVLVLLFFGSAWQHVIVPVGFPIIFSVAAGLAALLALERADGRGDFAACALLVLSIATYTTGLAFLVGVAISVLIRPDRRQRAWIFAIPLALYAAWWLWAGYSEQEGQTKLSNVLLIPSFVAESLAAVTAALTGLAYDFTNPSGGPGIELGWGQVLAVGAVVALALRIRRGDVPAGLWVSLAIMLTYWVLGALAAGPERAPSSVRYLYLGAVGVLLVATAAAAGIRFSRLGLAALFAVTAFSLATNLAFLRDGGAFFRNEYSSPLRAQFAMLELARDRVDPNFDPKAALPDVSPQRVHTGAYLAGVDRYGSPAFSLSELERQADGVRHAADQILASALRLRLGPSRGRQPAGACRRLRGQPPGAPITFEVPAGGATMRARAVGPALVTVGRFGSSPSAGVGTLSSGETAQLRIASDASAKPWQASVAGATAVAVCGLR